MKLLQYGKADETTYELEFLIEPEQFELGLAKAYRKNVGSISVPGFRKGKAPRSIIEKMYGEDVFYDDALNELLPIEYDAAIHVANVSPIDNPSVEVVEASKEKGATIRCRIPIMEIGEYKGLKATKKVHTVNENALASELKGMQDRNSRMVDKEGAAADGDFVTIDFEGFVDGEAFEGGKSEGYALQLGSNQFIPGFEEQIVGHAAGEAFDIEVSFPAEYHAEDLAGKPATFKITLHDVKQKELPELDDEFAKDVSEFDTLEELKADLRAKAEAEAEKTAQAEVENDLLTQVVDTMKADTPQRLVNEKVEEMINNFAYRLQMQGLNLETFLQYTGSSIEQMADDYREEAERQVKLRLVLDHIVKLENIGVPDEEVEEKIQPILEELRNSNYNDAQLQQVEPSIRKDLAADLAANKAIDLVCANAEITVETVTDDEEAAE